LAQQEEERRNLERRKPQQFSLKKKRRMKSCTSRSGYGVVCVVVKFKDTKDTPKGFAGEKRG